MEPQKTMEETVSDELARQAQTKFVTSLVERGFLKKPEIVAAFLAVPRHRFVNQFYEQAGANRRLVQASNDASWFEKIYSDTALVTQIKNRIPTSSSSQPGLMAQMLEALDIETGHRILEIGTGTGYNAALLAWMTGNANNVTTIEIDVDLARKAVLILDSLGYDEIHTCMCDGLDGYPINAPYDRIIATASYPYVPTSWLDQLAPGGILVMSVQTPLAGGLLKVTKEYAGGSVHGTFLDIPHVMFMSLQQQNMDAETNTNLRQDLMKLPVTLAVSHTREMIDPSLFEHSFPWRFWLHLVLPDAFLIWKHQGEKQSLFPVLIDPSLQSVVSFIPNQAGAWNIEVRGEIQLWERLQQSYIEWIRHETPSLKQYHFLANAQGKQWVTLDEIRWVLHE